MKTNCIHCNKEFSFFPSQTRGKFCSNYCRGQHTRKTRVEEGVASFRTMRKYLIDQNIYECVMCGNKGEWCGKPLSLQLDHIDGNTDNNNLDNLRWLCPNCHSQTHNWGVKNASSGGKNRMAWRKGL